MKIACRATDPNAASPRRPPTCVARPGRRFVEHIPRRLELCVGTAGLCAALVLPAVAGDVRKVGEFNASGLIFKDAVEIVALEDPAVEGVTLYVSDFKRSLADKVASLDFVNEPAQSSVTCAATGPIRLPDTSELGGSEGKQVFSETKSRAFFIFGNKTLRIRRIYDEEKRTLTYVSYSTRVGSAGEEGNVGTSRYRTSLCVVPVVNEAPKLVSSGMTESRPVASERAAVGP